MIVGERNPLAEIAEMLEPFRKICMGCGHVLPSAFGREKGS